MMNYLIPCPWRYFFHMDCPGCGFQRSLIALFRADLASSVALYPATIPILFLSFFTLLHLKFQFAKGAILIKYLQLFTGTVILVFYIYKIVTLKVFN